MNERVMGIHPSGIRKFANRVAEIPDAISLTIGQPDFEVPEPIKKAIIKAIDENKTAYTSNCGIEPLRSEISRYLKNKNIKFDKDEIMITVGGSEGLYAAMQGIMNSGDKVLIPNPAYPAYKAIAEIIGADVIEYDLNEDFTIDYSNLKSLIEKNDIKAMILSYPSNPTGAVLDKNMNDMLHEILKNKNIYVITDDIYAELIYDGEYYSIAQFDDMGERIVYVSGFSKIFSMTGLRLGYICAKGKCLDNIMKVHQYNVSCAPSIVQWGAVEGFKSAMEDVKYMKDSFKKRRDYCYKRLTGMGFECVLPKGAFYLFPSIKKFGMKSEKFCTRLLYEGKVACVPGSAFGKNGDNNIRISYCYSIEELQKAMDAIEIWIKNL